MRNTLRWGITIGVISGAVAWLGHSRSSETAVSLFPDLPSLVALLVLATIALRRMVRASMSLRAVAGAATALGATAGAIIALATLARGAMRWSAVSLPLAAVTLIGSFVVVIAVMNVIAITTFYAQNKTARAGV